MNTRAIAVTLLQRWQQTGYDFESLIHQYCQNNEVEQRDRDMIYHLVKGVIQYQAYLDFAISQALNYRISRLENLALHLLRIGAYQALMMDTPAHAFVNETVDAAKELGRKQLTSLVNGVLRHLPDKESVETEIRKLDIVQQLAVRHSHPEWLVEKWIADFGKDNTEKILRFNNAYQKIYLKHNPLMTEWQDLLEEITATRINIFQETVSRFHFFSADHPGKLLSDEWLDRGLFSIQDISQSLVVELLQPGKKDIVCDVCAAPGGKTVGLAQLMNNNGKILATDRNKKRLKKIHSELARLNVQNVEVSVKDAAADEFSEGNKFLIDAPCSGSGVIGRRADLRWNRKAEDLKQLTEIQYNILQNIAKYVPPKGILVYSTCSMEKEENWEQVDRFIKNHPDFAVQDARKIISENYCDERGAIHILPFKQNYTGAFAVRMQKTAD